MNRAHVYRILALVLPVLLICAACGAKAPPSAPPAPTPAPRQPLRRPRLLPQQPLSLRRRRPRPRRASSKPAR